jgi:addiction module RelE/StbE family toxin
MEIIFSEEFKKDYKRIKDRNLRLRIIKSIKKLEKLPESGKPLKYDLKGHRRLAINPFRIIYRIEGPRIIINCFEHRKDVYKR